MDFVPVCPEMEVGLGCPRDPIRVVMIGGQAHQLRERIADVLAEWSRARSSKD